MDATLVKTIPVRAREKHGTYALFLRINGVPYQMKSLDANGPGLALHKLAGEMEVYVLRPAPGDPGDAEEGLQCNCPDARSRGPGCKHEKALEAALGMLAEAIQ